MSRINVILYFTVIVSLYKFLYIGALYTVFEDWRLAGTHSTKLRSPDGTVIEPVVVDDVICNIKVVFE